MVDNELQLLLEENEALRNLRKVLIALAKRPGGLRVTRLEISEVQDHDRLGVVHDTGRDELHLRVLGPDNELVVIDAHEAG